MKKRLSVLVASLLLSSSVSALEWGMSAGMHDFVVQDIVNDTAADGISAGDSHTLGVNVGVYLNHTNDYGVNFLAKGEAFLDHDKDELDPDHIPVWFKFLIGANGPMITMNENHSFKWYVEMDNRQNTVSCIEREIRQNYGVGYEFKSGGFKFDINGYLGFYYIELDDDTPVARGYTRMQTDDGEAANMLEIAMRYEFDKHWVIDARVKDYNTNAGYTKLETDYIALVSYKSDWWGEGTSLNLNIEYNKYDFSRFTLDNPATEGRPIVPFDNDMLVQAYVTIPFGD
jgi:hypothetical protein